jgi:hypothetical protein
MSRMTTKRQSISDPIIAYAEAVSSGDIVAGPLWKRPRADGFAIEVEEVEQEKDKGVAVPCIRCGLDQAERGRAIGADAARLPVEICLSGRE